MTGDETTDLLLAARARLPEHVVRRAFPEETVVLNLETGMYHGLNQTAATMLDALERTATVGDAVGPLSAELDAPGEVVERDLLRLCRELSERGLVEWDAGAAG